MKKIIYSALLAAVSLSWSCSDAYDDSELNGRTNDLAARIVAAREQLNRLNDDLKSYADLVASLDGYRCITGVTEAAGVVTITYDNGDTDVLSCGAKGETGDRGDQGASGEKGPDGSAAEMPQLKIDPADGYWKISTDGGKSWTDVLDTAGQPVKGTGEAGAAGRPGGQGSAGKTPVLGIDAQGYWTADYGDGSGAVRILDADGRPVSADPSKLPDSLFRSARLSEDGSALIVELISGVRIEVPVAEAFVFMITSSGTELFEAGETRTFPLRQRGVAEIGIERPDGWAVKVSEEQVEITAPASGGEGEIVLWAVSSSARLKLAAIAVKAEGGDEPVDPVDPPVTGNVELDKLYGYGEKATGGEGAAASDIHHFDDGAKFQTWLLTRQKAKSTTPAIVWLSGTFTKDQGRSASSPWFDVKDTHNITIYGTDGFVMQNIGLFLVRASNIVIRNLYIQMPKADNGADGISMQDCENVWVDHCTFQSMNQSHDYEDGSCDITHATHGVTVSWCHFIQTQKSCLVGHSNSQTADKAITVTFHHNHFDASSSRHPRVRFGKAHVYNNFYDGCTTYGAGSAYGAMVLVEHNHFDAVALPTDICTYPAKPSGSSWVSNLQGSEAGFLYECDNEYVNNPSNFRGPFTNVEYTSYNGPKIAAPYRYEDFKPDYAYEVDEAARIPEIVPSGAGVGKLAGFDKAPIAVDNGGVTGGGTDPGPIDPVDPNLPVELANGWMTFDYNGSSNSVSATADGLSITACGKFESGNQKFGYVYREVTGDFELVATLDAYTALKSGNQAMAGILLTPDVTAQGTNLLHVMAGYNATGYYSRRVAAGNAGRGSLSASATGGKTVLKLVRTGSDCTVSLSADGGATFGTPRKESFATLPETVCVGLAVNSGDSSKTATARFSEVTLDGTPIGFVEE